MRTPTALLVGALLAFAGQAARADVTMPALFSDNMALQADKPLPVWGKADPDEKITVTLGDDKAEAAADKNGQWRVTLKPVKPGVTLTMQIAGKNKIEIKNILTGSVWVCSGQSNMQFGLQGSHKASEDLPKANDPQIRLFTVFNVSAETPQWDVPRQGRSVSRWVVCTPETAARFSAVAYYFGKELRTGVGVPVGLIDSSWGGTPAQSWTSLEALRANKALVRFAEAYEGGMKALPGLKEKREKDLANYEAEKKKWEEEVEKPYKEEYHEYLVALKKARLEKTPEPGKPVLARPAPRPPAETPGLLGAGTPTVLYNSMIAPLIPFAIEGAIWYQGESNAGLGDLYRKLFEAMITDWRTRWGQGDFPFYFVQLANFMERKGEPVDEPWAGLREAQRRTLELPNTGMAVAVDIGEARDIHPKNKAEVGRRLALWALRDHFKKTLVASGPLYKGMKIEGNKIRVSFTEIGGGLAAHPLPASTQPANAKGKSEGLEGFAIAGADGNFVWADAQIDGDTVVVSSDKVDKPTHVRYAWANNPACNLYNKEGLPASPFQTYGEKGNGK